MLELYKNCYVDAKKISFMEVIAYNELSLYSLKFIVDGVLCETPKNTLNDIGGYIDKIRREQENEK